MKHEGNWQNKLLSDDNYGKLEEMSCVIDDNVYKKKTICYIIRKKLRIKLQCTILTSTIKKFSGIHIVDQIFKLNQSFNYKKSFITIKI